MESRFTYSINPRRIFRLDGATYRTPTTLKLTKEEVLEAIKTGPVYRRFTNEGFNKRVTGLNLDRLHNERYISEQEWNLANLNYVPNVLNNNTQSEVKKNDGAIVEDTPIIEEPTEEPMCEESTTDEEDRTEVESTEVEEEVVEEADDNTANDDGEEEVELEEEIVESPANDEASFQPSSAIKVNYSSKKNKKRH